MGHLSSFSKSSYFQFSQRLSAFKKMTTFSLPLTELATFTPKTAYWKTNNQKYKNVLSHSTCKIDRTLAQIKPCSNNTHSSDLHKFCTLYEVLSDRSKCLNKETVLVLSAYPVKGPNLKLCQGSGIYDFITQWALQNLNYYGD